MTKAKMLYPHRKIGKLLQPKCLLGLISSSLIAISTPVSANDISTGNGFLEACSETGNDHFCQGYVLGALHVMSATGAEEEFGFVLRKKWRSDVGLRSFCAPEGIQLRQATDMVVKHIEEHPEDRHFRTPFLIHETFLAAFPCE